MKQRYSQKELWVIFLFQDFCRIVNCSICLKYAMNVSNQISTYIYVVILMVSESMHMLLKNTSKP